MRGFDNLPNRAGIKATSEETQSVSKIPVKAATPPAAKKAAVKTSPAAHKPAGKAAVKAPAKPVAKDAVAKAIAKPAATPSAAAPAQPARKTPTPPAATAKPASKGSIGRSSAAKPSATAAAPVAPRHPPLPPPNRPMSNVIDMPRPARKVDPKLVNVWKTKAGRELTDDELLAMPDSEYMNEKQLDFFRAKLEQQKDDLLNNAGETTEHLREDTSIVPDPADRATIEEEHALELRTRDRERKLLKKISQSLARIDAGDYGFCDETGEPIGLGRLLARPTATLSLEAQQRREMKQKMFGD
jgi:DnaK suppressor protein